MAHEIDFSTGTAAMAYVGETPWHGLGFQLPETASIEEWRQAAQLEWEARTAELEYGVRGLAGDIRIPVPDRLMLFRSDTNQPLSIVSRHYKPVQPAEVLEFFRDLVTEIGGFTMETAGALQGGKKVWALARAPKAAVIGTNDVVARYLLLATSYDLSMPTTVQQTSVRVVCMNTLRMSLANKALRTIHMHEWNPQAAKRELGLDGEWNEFIKAMESLTFMGPLDDSFVEKFYQENLFTDLDRSRPWFSEARANRLVGRLMELYHDGPGAELPTAKRTLYGALQSVTHHVDHVRRARTTDNRLNGAWFGRGAEIKDRVFQAALDFQKAQTTGTK